MKYQKGDTVMRPNTRDYREHNWSLYNYLGGGYWEAWQYPIYESKLHKIHESEFISHKEWHDKR